MKFCFRLVIVLRKKTTIGITLNPDAKSKFDFGPHYFVGPNSQKRCHWVALGFTKHEGNLMSKNDWNGEDIRAAD